MSRVMRTAGWIGGGVVGAAALAALGHLGRTWSRYGRAGAGGRADPLLDRFMPVYEVRERHEKSVEAPVADTYAAARDLDVHRSRMVRAIFRGRELLMGADGGGRRVLQPLVEETRALGWGLLAEVPGREVVMGAVTRPWEAEVTFRSLPPEEFARFDEPGYARIVWCLAAVPVDAARSLAATETRVATTDPVSRERFRRYWSLLSPGIILIRRLSLGLVKADAERAYGERTARRREGWGGL